MRPVLVLVKTAYTLTPCRSDHLYQLFHWIRVDNILLTMVHTVIRNTDLKIFVLN